MNAYEHDDTPAAEVVAAAVAPTPQDADDKPKRRRAARKAKTEGADSHVGAAQPAADVALAAPAPAPQSTSAPASASTPMSDLPAGVAEPGVAPLAPAGSPLATPHASSETGDAAAIEHADGARNSRRARNNRRRGRRGGERRGEATASAADGPHADADAAGEPAAVLREPAPTAQEVFAEVLAGRLDADEPDSADDGAQAIAEPSRRVLLPQPDSPKLHKVLAQAGTGSRRDLEQMIVEGRLTVNGEPAHTGQRVSFGDRIELDGKPVRYRIAPPPARVLAYHKPAGEVVTHDDPEQRPTVFRRLPRLAHGKWQSVGRLDINTEGLLLFTSSGELANLLMHPRFGVEREYAVRSLGELSDEARARLLEGVEVDGQRAAFKSIEDGGGEGVNRWYRVVITEGRNREVRKLFEAVGHAVSRLIRIRYGSVVLPRGLRRGVWVELGADDVRALRRLAQPQRAAQDGAGDGEPRGSRDGRDSRDNSRNSNKRGRRTRSADRARGPRPDMGSAVPMRPPAHDDHDNHDDERHDHIDGAAIPNPLQQTYDKRAIQQARTPRREYSEDGPIPNPLQQTYDKRALQRERQPRREYSEDGPIPNPLQQTYDKRFAQGPSAGGVPGNRRKGGKGAKSGKPGQAKPGTRGAAGAPGGQPDPMRTSVGYIGADAFLRKGARGGGRGGRGSGGGRSR
ncbi:MAG: pseudouridine synthase [Proteobacteria bacterium]|nr:pseudouridine synthase [Pseudomonadota bacterium]